MATIGSSPIRVVKEYTLIALGIFLYVFGWSLFLLPNNLVGGGVTGMASIVQYATHGFIKVSWTYFTLNIGLLIASIFVLGKSFGGKTVFAVVLASLFFEFVPGLIPQEIVQTLSFDNGKLMSVIMGGILVGTGIGMTMSQGGSTGGTDIIALMVNKYRNVSPGRMILMMDAVIIFSSLLVPSYKVDGSLMPMAEKIVTVVYGFLLVTVNSYVLDLYLTGSRRSVQLFVLSKKYSEIADAVTRDLHRGVTVLEGKGWFTKQESNVLMILTRKSDLNTLLRYIKSIDPEVFMSVISVTGVYGKGFDALKVSSKDKKQKKA